MLKGFILAVLKTFNFTIHFLCMHVYYMCSLMEDILVHGTLAEVIGRFQVPFVRCVLHII